jgi:hypothetical protein
MEFYLLGLLILCSCRSLFFAVIVALSRCYFPELQWQNMRTSAAEADSSRCFFRGITAITANRGAAAGSAIVSRERLRAQEIEIAPAIGLQDFAAVERGIAAFGNRRRRDRTPPQLLRRDQEVEPALLDR